jgi:membrane fusion protein (multidrug efflux system)
MTKARTLFPAVPAPALAVALFLAGAASWPACAGARAGGSRDDPPAGRPPVAVELARVDATDVLDAVDVVGSLAPKVEAEIKSEYTGTVTDVYVTEWVRVKAGTPLARLDSRETAALLEAARAAVQQAEVAETRAVRELERAQNLAEFGLVTDQQLDDARTAREAAATAVAAARAQLRAVEARLAKTLIRSPIDGVVAFRGINVGDRVESMGSGAPMFRIVDTRVLELTVQVPSADVAAVRTGQPLEFRVEAVPDRTFTGRVMFINPAADPVSRSVRVLADVPNADGALRAGLFVKGRILTGRRSGVLQVPRAALLQWDQSRRAARVFVVRQDVAEPRDVTTGRDAGALVEVVGGLEPGERVVTRGAFLLRPGDRVKVAGEAAASS